MRRRPFTLCSALSLLMCVAVCALWVRSYRAAQFVGWSGPARFVGVLSMGYERALQMRADAAAASGFSPDRPGDRPAPGGQGA